MSDVAHAQDPAGEAVRVEDLEGVGLLAGAQELDRDAGDRADRERGAAAGVAVDLGQDEAGDRDGAGEALGDGHGLLAGHRVHDQQRLDRAWSPSATAADLVHERVVDGQAAGGVDDHDVAADALGVLDAAAGDVHGRACRPARGRRRCRGSCRASRAGRRRPAGTGPRRRGAAAGPSLTMCLASFAADVVLPEPWRPTSAITAGVADEPEGPVARRQERGQLLVDDLHDLLAGGQALEDLGADARSRTRATKSLTTLKLTSASSRARRTSRIAASTSASVTRPRPVSPARVLRRRSLRLSNMRGRGPL